MAAPSCDSRRTQDRGPPEIDVRRTIEALLPVLHDLVAPTAPPLSPLTKDAQHRVLEATTKALAKELDAARDAGAADRVERIIHRVLTNRDAPKLTEPGAIERAIADECRYDGHRSIDAEAVRRARGEAPWGALVEAHGGERPAAKVLTEVLLGRAAHDARRAPTLTEALDALRAALAEPDAYVRTSDEENGRRENERDDGREGS